MVPQAVALCCSVGQRSKKSMSEPSTFARLTVGNCVKKSRVCVKSSEPKWEENFQFLVYDPRQQDIEIIVSTLGLWSGGDGTGGEGRGRGEGRGGEGRGGEGRGAEGEHS